MDPQTLLDNFATIADAPGGVQRLRGMVRQLGVTGRLAAPGEPAGRRNDGPFEIPAHWTWSSMQELHTKLGSGSTPRGGKNAYVSRGVAFIRSQNVWNDGLRLSGVARVPEETHAQMAGTAVRPGDVLLNITGASIGRACVVPDDFDEEANVSQHVAILRPHDPRRRRWVHLFMVSPAGFDAVMSDQVGISREGLSMKRLRGFAVPVPPILEQERIVAKVDELMGLCDDLEARQERRHRSTTHFRASALHALSEAETPDDLRHAWARASNNWSALADSPDALDDLRRSVVHLAVTGHLVHQDLDDEPADLLLSRFEEGSLVDRSSAVVPVRPEDEPWQLPATWRWVRFKQIVNFAAGRTPPTKDATYWSDAEGHHWVSIGDMPEGGAVTTTARRVSKRAADEIFRQRPDPVGTILMSFKLTIGKVARLAVPAFHNEAIISIETPFDETSEYLFRTLPLLTKGGASKAAIMGNTLNKSALTNLLIPLPPLAEQGRIVDKVDHLTDLCSDLEQALIRRSGAAAQVANGLTARMAPTAVSD